MNRRKPLLGGQALAALVSSMLVAGLLAVPARADHTIVATDFALTANDHQAGASPNASSWTTLTYPGLPNTDDIKKTIGHFAPGMLANPEAVPHCKQELYLADACPADTRIGESVARIHVLPPAGPVSRRRAASTTRSCSPTRRGGSASSWTRRPPRRSSLRRSTCAPRRLRAGRILDDLPRSIAGIGDIQILHLGFTLYGTVQGRNFTRGPTSCTLKVSTGDGYAYDHPGPISGPPTEHVHARPAARRCRSSRRST